MLKPDVVAEIRERLATGESQRSVARSLGIARGTVDAIASGKTHCQPEGSDEDPALFDPASPLVRCPTCGRRVHAPCGPCQIEAIKRAAKRPPSPDPPVEIGLDLAPGDRLRYEQIRHRW